MGLFGKQHKKDAAEYVLKKASDYHEAFGTTAAIYNEDSEQIEALPADKDLEKSLIEYNESIDPQFRFDVRKCTFEDVLAELDQAREGYENKAKGVRGFLRHAVRSAGDYANQISLWIDMIPSDCGLNILSAGLKIVFQIARQNAANRDKILEAFEDIPNLMLSVKTIQNQWSTAKALRRRATILYETLARAMAKLIILLNGSIGHAPKLQERAKKILERLGGSGRAADAIQSILNEVQNQAELFDQCLERVRDQLAIDSAADVQVIKAATERTEATADRTEAELKALAQASEKRHAELIELTKAHGSGPVIMNLMHKTIIYIQPVQDSGNSSAPPFSAGVEYLLDQIELHEILGVSPQYPTNDLQLVLKELSQFGVSAQSQAQQLFTSRVFASWMASVEPAIMLVHGNFDSGPGRITALSVLCALFALELRSSSAKDGQVIVLHYFCGLHGSRYNALDSLSGPNGLIRSILAQLLQTGWRFDLDFINTKSFVYELENHSLQMLCHTFHQLIEQLPRKFSVICILDGLSEFASERFGGELADVLLILNRLANHSALRPNFKLLATTPFAQDRWLGQQLTVNYPLKLHSAVEDGYRTGFTERSFPDLVSRGGRLDHFRMRMQRNRAAEQENYYSDSEDDSDSSE
ncbi:hypothetical protein ZTR_09374 [Talaromyces verruculosus]|nr:hypothetical protein ZTR_09374 [Talaromyces verruculosus]